MRRPFSSPRPMNQRPSATCLKVDVDTHDGMRDGVPRLLDSFKAHGVRATFFLAFGPDNSGKAIWNVFRSKGFLKKMLRTGAPKLYGWRTVLSGTLLPARPIAVKFPEIVRRIAGEGHEVGVHAWDHRLWQDHLDELTPRQIAEQFDRSYEAFEKTLGRAPRAAAAPAWCVTPASLAAQDGRRLLYASDMRGQEAGFPEMGGYRSTTLQIPTTQFCLEELLAVGHKDLEFCAERVLATRAGASCVVPLHAEVEGGPYNPFLKILLNRIRASGAPVLTLQQRAEELLSAATPPPILHAEAQPMHGRAGRVAVMARDRETGSPVAQQ